MLKSKAQRIFQNDWVIAGFLFIVFLLANGYTYGWDDQHVEIPLLKSLIDSSLYPGDYYVESLKKNFTSILYPILARLITINQIPTAYLILYALSRYFFFFWMYKFWLLVAKEKRGAVICTLTIILLARVEEFLYRSFSHQEFALAVIMAGFYFFYKERFYIAALLWGFAANFHALYSLFPMLYMLFFLLLERRKFGWQTFFKSGVIFTVSSAPFLIWTLRKYTSVSGGPVPTQAEWIPLYQLACPQNFTFLEIPLKEMAQNFKKFVAAMDNFFLLLLLFILNYSFHDTFQKDKKIKSMLLCAAILLVFSFIFSYVIPARFILDLNLVRNAQYMLFILAGYSALLVLKILQEKNFLIGLLLVFTFTLLRFGDTIGCLAALIMICILGYSSLNKQNRLVPTTFWHFVLIILAGAAGFILIKTFMAQSFGRISTRSLQVIGVLLLGSYLLSFFIKDALKINTLKTVIVFIPYLLWLGNYGFYHYKHLQIEKRGGGFWQMQRNWIALGNYIKRNTPKNALFLIPHDMEMGGFRIFAERPIIMEYRDCGIVGFDYHAGADWYRRLKEIEHFKIFIDGNIEPAIKKAIVDYKVNYIVFMRYLKPNNPLLEEIYQNEVFALYKVRINPVQ